MVRLAGINNAMDDDTMRSGESLMGDEMSLHSRQSWGSSDGSRQRKSLHQRASDFGGSILTVITQKRIEWAEKKKTELNILCSDLVVSTEFTLGRFEFVQETPAVTTVELEDLIERQDQTLFLNARELLTCDKRPWQSVAFMDHLYSEERLERYLNLKRDLWRLIEVDVIKRKIPVQFQAILDINRGTTIESLIASFQNLQEAQHLHSIEFDGAIFGFVPWDIPKELLRLCRNGYLRETISLKVLFQREEQTQKTTKSAAKQEDEQGEPETAAIGKRRSVRVLGACIVRLQGLLEQNKHKDGENDKEKEAKKGKSEEGGGPKTAKRASSLTALADDDDNKPATEEPSGDEGAGLPPLVGGMPRSASTGDLDDAAAKRRDARAQANHRWNAARPVIDRMSSRKKLIAMRKGLRRMINDQCEQALWERELDIDEVDEDNDDSEAKISTKMRISRSRSMGDKRQQRRGSMGRERLKGMSLSPPPPPTRSSSMDASFSSLLHSNLGRSSRWKPDDINSRRALTPPPGSRHLGGRKSLRRSATMEDESLGESSRRRSRRQSVNTLDESLGGSHRRRSRRQSMTLEDASLSHLEGGRRQRSSLRRSITMDDEPGRRRSGMRRSITMDDECLPDFGSSKRRGSLHAAPEQRPSIGEIQRQSGTLNLGKRSLTPPPSKTPRRGSLLTSSGPLTPPRAAASRKRISMRTDNSMSRRSRVGMDGSSSRGRRRVPRRSFSMDDNPLAKFQTELTGILPSLRPTRTQDEEETTLLAPLQSTDAETDKHLNDAEEIAKSASEPEGKESEAETDKPMIEEDVKSALETKDEESGADTDTDKPMIEVKENVKTASETKGEEAGLVAVNSNHSIDLAEGDSSSSSEDAESDHGESSAPPYDWAAVSMSNLHNSLTITDLISLGDASEPVGKGTEPNDMGAEECSTTLAGSSKRRRKKNRKAKSADSKEGLRNNSCPDLTALVRGKKKKSATSNLLSSSAHTARSLPRPRIKKTTPKRSLSEHSPMRGSLAPHQFFSESMSALEIEKFYSSVADDDSETDTDDEDEFAHASERPSFNWETSQQNFNWKFYATVADN